MRYSVVGYLFGLAVVAYHLLYLKRKKVSRKPPTDEFAGCVEAVERMYSEAQSGGSL